MLLQAITIRDQLYESQLRSVDFIKRFIFPGGDLLSVRAMIDAAARYTDMKLFHLEDIGPHYARTLKHWRERFLGTHRRGALAGLPGEFPAPVGVLSVLLRRRIRGAPTRRRANAIDQTTIARRASIRPFMPQDPEPRARSPSCKAVVGDGGWLGPQDDLSSRSRVDFRRLYRG